jgi:hypothetical protein
MKQLVGQEITGKVVSKIKAKTGIWDYNPFPSIEHKNYDRFIYQILESISFDSICIISSTVPWNICKIISMCFSVPVTVLGKHPSLFLIEEELKSFKGIDIKKQNIFTKGVNDYIKENDLIIIHDYQYMVPLQYLPYDLTNKQVLVFSCDRRFDFDEQINQNYNNLTIGNSISKLNLKDEIHYCSKL